MTVKALPRSPLKVVKTEFFFHLLVSLLANPTRLDGGCQGASVPALGSPGLASRQKNAASVSQRGVVDHQHSITAADELIRLNPSTASKADLCTAANCYRSLDD
jgi:hypothetical protein